MMLRDAMKGGPPNRHHHNLAHIEDCVDALSVDDIS
jgi:hypothetical protein